MSAITKKLSRSNGSSPHSNAKTGKPKRAAQNGGGGGAPDDRTAAAATANGGFDSPWLGALPFRWRAQRPD